jgi:hypothetical protein
MKTQHIHTILLLIIGVGLFLNYFQKEKPIEVIIPEQKGSTGTQIIENVKTIPIPIPGGTEVIVDEKWYKEYLEAKDSLERLNKYVQAIQIKSLDTTFIDNDTIKLSGNITTRGSLLSYKFDYNIKERKFEYTPEVKRPRLSLIGEVGTGIPTQINQPLSIYGAAGFENQKGLGVKVGYDTQGVVRVGLTKSITIIK